MKLIFSFLALPHGTAASYATPLIKAGKKVIDLSADFRIRSAEIYKEFYGAEHPVSRNYWKFLSTPYLN